MTPIPIPSPRSLAAAGASVLERVPTRHLAPRPAVERLTELLPHAPEVRYEVCPGGHLGALTGRAARRTTWVQIDAFLAAHDRPARRPRSTAAKETPRVARQAR